MDTPKNPENTSDENAANQSTADSTLSTPAHQTAVSSKSTTEISAVCSEPAQEQPPEQLLEEETDDINEQTAVSNNDQVIDNDSKQDNSSQRNINDEPLAKVARFTNVETDSVSIVVFFIIGKLFHYVCCEALFFGYNSLV